MAKIDQAFNEGTTSANDLPSVVKELKEILLPLAVQQNASTVIFSNEAFSGTLWLHNQNRRYPSFELRVDV